MNRLGKRTRNGHDWSQSTVRRVLARDTNISTRSMARRLIFPRKSGRG
jgi:hypothetical protein